MSLLLRLGLGSLLVVPCLGVSTPSIASAAADFDLGITPQHPQVIGGTPAEECAWPDTVAVTGGGSLCSGSLVHPRVVVFAAHCGGGDKRIRLGETDGGARTIETERCATNPAYVGTTNQAEDWAYCILLEPVTEIPVTPVLFGCEDDLLQNGVPAVVAGFGDGGPDGSSGTKRWAMTQVNTVFGNTATIGGGGMSTCSGDSGSSAFLQAADGSWRAFSITSTGTPDCDGTAGTHSLIRGAVEWIESDSQVDITPCYDLDGSWNPTPECGNFFAGGSTGFGTWADWCSGTPSVAVGTQCGDAYDATPDNDAPTVSVTAPGNGEELPSGTPVTIQIDALDEPGWGVRNVWVVINGMEQAARDTYPPYAFADVPFPDGEFTVVAFAEDWAGQIGESAPLTFGVGVTPTGAETGGGSATASGGSGSGSAESGDPDGGTAGMNADDGGCSCRSNPSTQPWWLVLLVVVAVRKRVAPRSP